MQHDRIDLTERAGELPALWCAVCAAPQPHHVDIIIDVPAAGLAAAEAICSVCDETTRLAERAELAGEPVTARSA